MSGLGIEVATLDPRTGAVLKRISATRPVAARWWVYRARISSDESRAYVSYHGQGNGASSGVDWVDLSSGDRCPQPAGTQSRACLDDVHGDFDFVGSELIGAAGDDVVKIDRNDQVVQQFPIPLIDDYGVQSHFMNVTVDAIHREAFGSVLCRIGAGVNSVALDSQAARSALPANSGRLCGDFIRPVVGGNLFLLVNYSPGRITVIDRTSGATTDLRSGVVGDSIVDVLAIPR
jgi:hypothetical protein